MLYSKIWSNLSNFPILKFIPPIKWVIKKWMVNSKNSTFTWKMCYLKWYNIHANNVALWWTFFQDIWKVFIWSWTIFWYDCMLLTSWYKDTSNLLINPVIKDIHIWKNVWVTSRVIILWWVTIWDNVIIGAWSVVVKDIPSNTFAAWNPCRVIKQINN
jgi:acetyltransferase-like isoleucine patch superfamily enzyme